MRSRLPVGLTESAWALPGLQGDEVYARTRPCAENRRCRADLRVGFVERAASAQLRDHGLGLLLALSAGE